MLFLAFITIMRRKPSGEFKPIIRGKIERDNFIERMDFNVARANDWLMQDNKPLMYITRIDWNGLARVELKKPPESTEASAARMAETAAPAEQPAGAKPGAPETAEPPLEHLRPQKRQPRPEPVYLELPVVLMVGRKLYYIPIIHKPIRLFGKPLPFGLGLGKPEGYIFKKDNLSIDPAWPMDVVLTRGKTAWRGADWIFYDNDIPHQAAAAHVREFMAQTDLENYSADVYAIMQELSVVRPEFAHATLTDTLEIEKKREERRKQTLMT